VEWAAVNSRKAFESNTCQETSVTDIVCTLRGLDNLGDIQSGKLTLSARIVAAQVVEIAGIDEIYLATSERSTKLKMARMIPDLPAADLAIEIGSTLYCALLYRRSKGNDTIWAALALRPFQGLKDRKKKKYREPSGSIEKVWGPTSKHNMFGPDNGDEVYRPNYFGWDDEDEVYERIGLVTRTEPPPHDGSQARATYEFGSHNWFTSVKARSVTIV
jgi:hypothetical protein